MIDKTRLSALVEIFYQQRFKIFYVNSCNGEEFTKPVGVFVSLGISTPLETIKRIKDVINSEQDWIAKVSEIETKKEGNQYLNYISKLDVDFQYSISKPYPKEVMEKEEAEKKLEELSKKIDTSSDPNDLKEFGPKVIKLKDLINEINWEEKAIGEKSNGKFFIFHKKVNYIKTEDEIEHRIGIYVMEK